LKIQSARNFIDQVYVSHGNLFIHFKNVGNSDFKYNLIEIKDMGEFIKRYEEGT
jgi:hypothetical protein